MTKVIVRRLVAMSLWATWQLAGARSRCWGVGWLLGVVGVNCGCRRVGVVDDIGPQISFRRKGGRGGVT